MMGNFDSSYFLDVKQSLPPGSVTLNDLQVALTTMSMQGGTFYFQAGSYIVDDEFTVPGNVTFQFEPGAVLILIGDLKVWGCIDAGPHPIFLPTGGQVVFLGSRTTEVYPEWWSFPTQTEDDGPMLQAAIEAAYVNRNGLPAIPVVLSGIYELATPVTVAANASLSDGFHAWGG